MIRVEVEIKDHSDDVMLAVIQKSNLLCAEAAKILAANYRQYLTRNIAKPHSKVGRVPHAYDGPNARTKNELWATESADPSIKNNRPETGFAKEQTDFLANYIQASNGNIGFARDGHVANRTQNYLIAHDGKDRTHKIQNGSGGIRPWIVPIYERFKNRLVSQLGKLVRAGAFITSSSDVPF